MKYYLSLFLLSVLAASLALSQTNTATSSKTANPPQTASHQTIQKKTAPATTSTAKTSLTAKKTGTSQAISSKKGRSTKRPVATAYRQMAPSPERYKEIQQALIDKGYLKTEANGVWDDQSSEALRQFQTDQKLSPTGKLSSASLIGLGLGRRQAQLSPISRQVKLLRRLPQARL